MRRRPSGSGEDENAPRSASASSRTGRDKTRAAAAAAAAAEMTSRDSSNNGRGSARQSLRIQERKQSRSSSISPASEHRTTTIATNITTTTATATNNPTNAPWPRTSISSPALEKKDPLDNHDETPPSPPKLQDVSAPMADHLRQNAARLRSPWQCSLLTLATSLTAIVLLLTIIHSFSHRQQDPKGCAMSYMIPRFNHFSDFDTEHTRFASKYSLYLYREGGVDEDVRVKGIPVLFIPGNAGSYKQVRPVAAEAAYYFHHVLRENADAIGDGKRPLDFFTVDFNEELIAFHGQTLLDQAEYLNEAVAYILSLYHQPQRSLREPGLPDPRSVMILGHSMGGVVARTMLRMPNYQEHSINTIITLSAPHARPPISFDSAMVETYNDVNTFWRDSYSGLLPTGENPLDDVTLVSVAGGGLDTMIPSEYTSLTSLVPDTHGFTVFTSSIPNVWTGMDHLAIMWCDQFRKALVKAIFDVVDVRRPEQTRTRPERVRAFRKRLLTGMEPVVEKGLLEQEPNFSLTLEHPSTTIMSHGERLVLRSLGDAGTTKVHILPIPAQPFADGSKFTLLTDQSLDVGEEDGTMSVLLCSISPPSTGFTVLSYSINLDSSSSSGSSGNSGSTKLACKNAAPDVSLLPASTNETDNGFGGAKPFSYLQYGLSTIADYQFVAVLDQAKEPLPGWVVAEFSNPADSSIKVSKGHHQILMSGMKITLPAERPMMTELKIPEVHSTLFAYRFEVDRKPCGRHSESFAPLMRQYIAEPYESKYFVNVKGGNINVHGLSPYMPPPLLGGGATEGLSLQFWTDPTCNSTVDVSLKVDVLGSAGKLVMRYRTVFTAFQLLVVALVLRKQFKVYDSTGVFMSFTQSMDQCIRTSLPAIFVALTFFAIAVSKSSHSIWTRELLSTSTGTSEQVIDFTVNDLLLGTSDPFFWFLVPLFAIISVGICVAMNYVVLTLTHILALIISGVRAWTRRAESDARNPSPGATNAATTTTTPMNQRFIITGILVLMVVTVIPYQFAYLMLCIVQVATCIQALKSAQQQQQQQDSLRRSSSSSSSSSSSTSSPSTLAHSHNFYNYAHSILVLMLWILPINMPVLVVWVHNLAVHWLTPFSTHHNLLSVLGYILLVETMSTKNMIPRVTRRFRHLTNVIIFILAIYAAAYGVTYAFRMHYAVNGLCFWLFLIHLSHGPASSLSRLAQYAKTADAPDSPFSPQNNYLPHQPPHHSHSASPLSHYQGKKTP